MKQRSTATRSGAAVAALLAATMLVAAPLAHAQLQSSRSDPDGLGKALSYGGCATGLVVAITPTQFWMAMFHCARILLDELGL